MSCTCTAGPMVASRKEPLQTAAIPFIPNHARPDRRQGCQMAKFDPFLSLDCARVEGLGAQGGGCGGAICHLATLSSAASQPQSGLRRRDRPFARSFGRDRAGASADPSHSHSTATPLMDKTHGTALSAREGEREGEIPSVVVK